MALCGFLVLKQIAFPHSLGLGCGRGGRGQGMTRERSFLPASLDGWPPLVAAAPGLCVGGAPNRFAILYLFVLRCGLSSAEFALILIRFFLAYSSIALMANHLVMFLNALLDE